MKCPHCNKDYNEPLMVSNGTFICPNCFLNLTKGKTKFSFTEENRELYNLSQVAFFNGLKKNDESLILKSVELAKEAYDEGNPYGLLHLGFCYDKDLIEKDKTEKYRMLVAYEYYSLIVYSNQTSQDFTGQNDFNELKYRAATLLLNMLASGQDKNTEERYTVDYNYNRIKNVVGDLKKPEVNLINKTKTLKEKVFDYMINKGVGKPLLSIYKLSFQELGEIVNDETFYKYYKNIVLSYRQDDSVIQWISTKSQLNDCIQDCENNPSGNTYLVLYNKKYNYKFLKKRYRAKVEDLLLQNSSLLVSLMENINNDEIFILEDDIYYVSKGKKINTSTVDGLINFIIRGE